MKCQICTGVNEDKDLTIYVCQPVYCLSGANTPRLRDFSNQQREKCEAVEASARVSVLAGSLIDHRQLGQQVRIALAPAAGRWSEYSVASTGANSCVLRHFSAFWLRILHLSAPILLVNKERISVQKVTGQRT